MKLTATVGSLLGRKGRQVWSIPPTATVYDAIAMMAAKEVGALVVMAGDELLGLISERDYTRKVILQGRSSRETRVGEVMIADPVTVTPDKTIDECMHFVTSSRIRHLPVVEHGRVVGVVSIGDLVKWTIAAHEESIAHLNQYITGGYPG